MDSSDEALQDAVRAAVGLRRDGEYAQAIAVLEEVLTVLGSRNVRLRVHALNELGMACKYSGRFAGGRTAYQEALRLAESCGAGPSVLADLLHNVAGLAHAAGDAEAAREIAVLGTRLRGRTRHNPVSVVQDDAALAAILIDLGEIDDAERALRLAIDSPDGQEPLEQAVTLANLGTVQYRRGDFPAAVASFRRALDIKIGLLGAKSVEVGVTMLNLGVAYVRMSLVDEAGTVLHQAENALASGVVETSPALRACRRYLESLDAMKTTGAGASVCVGEDDDRREP